MWQLMPSPEEAEAGGFQVESYVMKPCFRTKRFIALNSSTLGAADGPGWSSLCTKQLLSCWVTSLQHIPRSGIKMEKKDMSSLIALEP